MIKLKEILQDSVLDERIVYHGTISDFVDKIKASGKLKSVQAGAQKVSGGLTTEKGLIWVSPNFEVANYYASGMESNNEYNIEKGLKANYGGVFEIEIDDNLKLIDRNGPLTKEQIDILNSKFIPHYKPLKIGDTLTSAEWRSNGKQLHDMVKALGFDGVIYSKDQIGIVADELPIKVFHHKPIGKLNENNNTMKLSKYAKLLIESNLTPDAFDRKLKAAVETIFDVDDVKIRKSRIAHPPSFAHLQLSTTLFFNYRNIPLRMVIHFYHLKFSSNELTGLSNAEWNDMLKTAEQFPKLDTPEEILKSSNPQVKLNASITYYPYVDMDDSMIDFEEFRNNHIGTVSSNNLRDLVTKAKKLIDDLGGGDDNNGPDEPEPVSPTPTSGKLVTV